jgi:hypothetical protein
MIVRWVLRLVGLGPLANAADVEIAVHGGGALADAGIADQHDRSLTSR